jgi:hypothetical protein
MLFGVEVQVSSIGDERPSMTQMLCSSVLRVVACVLMLCASVPTFGVAAQVQHTDNDLGCLSQVIDGQGTFSPTTTAEGKRNGASQ